MSEWREFTIGEIADVFDGPHATPKKVAQGPWFLSISSLRSGRLVLSESAHVTEEDFAKWTRRVTPQAGDVLFSYETRLGEAALMPEGIRACLGRRMGLLRPKRELVDPQFLLLSYLSPRFQETIKSRKIPGATVDRIPLTDLPSWPIHLPSMAIQRAIAEALGALDDKIAVNEHIIGSSIQLCTALHQKLHAQSEQEAELGEVVDLLYGKSLPKSRRAPGDIPVYGSGGPSGTHEKALVPGPGIIIGRKGTVGSVYWSEGDFFPIDTTFYTSLKSSSASLEYLYFTLKQLNLASMNSDSAVPGLNRSEALSRKIRIPEPSSLNQFTQQAREIFAQTHARNAESRTLAELRDTLLPQLMSGKLRVKDAEKIVEDNV